MTFPAGGGFFHHLHSASGILIVPKDSPSWILAHMDTRGVRATAKALAFVYLLIIVGSPWTSLRPSEMITARPM